jgi:hypothetical protein
MTPKTEVAMQHLKTNYYFKIEKLTFSPKLVLPEEQ